MEELTPNMHRLSVQKAKERISKKLVTWAVGGEPPSLLNRRLAEFPFPTFQAQPVAPSTGVLHLLRFRYGASDMPTICHKSMTWLLYFKAMMNAYPTFHVETQYVDYDAGKDVVVPRLVTIDDRIYDDLEDFNRKSELTLDVKTRNQMTKVEQEAIQKIEERKRIVSEHLVSLEEALIYGYSLLGPQEATWTTQSVLAIKERIGIHGDGIDERLQQVLIQNMRNACQSLSEVLGNKTFFLDDLRIECANETNFFDKYHKGLSTVTTMDVKHAAIAMLIMKCFEDGGPQDLSYTCTIKSVLHRHIALWSHAERLYSARIKEKLQAHDYCSRDRDDHIAQALGGGPQASGNFGDVYKVSLPKGSDWELPEGHYAFKFANAPSSNGHLECEIGTLQLLPPYDYVANLLGYGKIDDRRFLITKWEHGGDLETRIRRGDLTWEHVKNILKGIAYALHMIHRTATCIVDLKPANILLNEAHDPILCDMGAAAGSGSSVPEAGTQTYHDGSTDATPERDVFGYGVILFRMVSNEVDTQVCGRLIGEKIVTLIEKVESLKEMTKKLIGMGCPNEMTAQRILQIGARCFGKSEKRPSALDIYKALQDLGF